MESINFHEFKEISGEIRNYFYSKISEVHFVSSLRNLMSKRTQKKKRKINRAIMNPRDEISYKGKIIQSE